MSYVRHTKPQDDYWSEDSIMHSTFPSAVKLSRNICRQICRYLHVNNDNLVPRGQLGYDFFFRICPIDKFSAKTKECYYPGYTLTLDEAICPYRGRFGAIIYMKNKLN